MSIPNPHSYDDISRLVNHMFLETSDVRFISKSLQMDVEGVWECIGFKDYFDFEETEENRLFVYEIHHIGSMNNL